MEIQFFGATGHAQRTNVLDCVEINDQAQNLTQEIQAEYDCEVRILGRDETLSVVKNFKIDQLRVMDYSISPQTILSFPESISNAIKFEGLSLIRITDSNLQLQKVSGVSIMIRSTGSEKPLWSFNNATVQGLEATVSKSGTISAEATESPIDNDHLFGNTEIPTNFYRSCLLSPRFFNVINR